MVDKPSGPVKPPVIDAKPRPKEPARPKPAAKAAIERSAQAESAPDAANEGLTKSVEAPETGAARPAPPRPAEKAATPLVVLALAALGGAVVTGGLLYGAAALDWWPQPQARPVAEALAGLETRLARLEGTGADDRGALAALDERVQPLETLAARVEAVESAQSALPEDERDAPLAALGARLDTLADKVAAMETGVSSTDADEIAGLLAGLRGDLAALEQRLEGSETARNDLAVRIESLEAERATQAALADVRAERDRMARLPAAIAALDAAIAQGRPFLTELTALENLGALVPDDAHRLLAAEGAPSSAEAMQAYRQALPALLAARPAEPGDGLLEGLWRDIAATIALRPTGEIAGDGPEAGLARLEAALAADDPVAARAALAALPAAMQEHAQQLEQLLAARLAAGDILATVRSGDAGGGQ